MKPGDILVANCNAYWLASDGSWHKAETVHEAQKKASGTPPEWFEGGEAVMLIEEYVTHPTITHPLRVVFMRCLTGRKETSTISRTMFVTIYRTMFVTISRTMFDSSKTEQRRDRTDLALEELE